METIGKLIEEEVRKQGLSISHFADLICCKRNNVYNIFSRNTIDIELLRRISVVLEHNFFMDLASNMELAKPELLDERELERIKAVNQFFEVLPNVITDLGLNATVILLPKHPEYPEMPLPDYVLTDYNITFTVGQTYEEKCNGFWGNGMSFFPPQQDSPSIMEDYINQANRIQYLNIVIEYKTAEEWKQTIISALKEIDTFYLPYTKSVIINDRLEKQLK